LREGIAFSLLLSYTSFSICRKLRWWTPFFLLCLLLFVGVQGFLFFFLFVGLRGSVTFLSLPLFFPLFFLHLYFAFLFLDCLQGIMGPNRQHHLFSIDVLLPIFILFLISPRSFPSSYFLLFSPQTPILLFHLLHLLYYFFFC
jgi:hypothetical protein